MTTVAVCIPFRASVSAVAVDTLVPAIVTAARQVEGLHWLTETRCQTDLARTRLLRRALDTDADWQWWIDDDAHLPVDTFERLWAHRDRADIICVWYVRRGDGRTNTWDALTVEKEGEGHRITKGALLEEPPTGDGRRIGATGFHCLLVSRKAAEAVVAATDGQPFQSVTRLGRKWLGEDFWFFQYAAIAGLTVWQAPVKVGHVGETIYE